MSILGSLHHRPIARAPWAPIDIRLYKTALFICAAMLGLAATQAHVAGVLTSAAIGALLVLRAPAASLTAAVLLFASLGILKQSDGLPCHALLIVEALAAAFIPQRLVTTLLRMPRWSWAATMVIASACLCAPLIQLSSSLRTATIMIASLCAFHIGAGLTRHLAMVDARLVIWGEEGLFAVTRDLLLGRVTSGMLHDLAQPLNVVSMANGNMGYIVEHLEINDEERRQLLDRVARVATHTQHAATILSLFRWFGRDGSDDPVELTVKSALDRAVSATKSNVRHHDVGVELQGNALGYLLPSRHGALEVMAVAALLCAFASFISAEGEKRRGKVVLEASLTPAHVVVSVRCIDSDGHAIPGKNMDNATLWLVEQVGLEAFGDFRTISRDSDPLRFVIRLGRDDNG